MGENEPRMFLDLSKFLGMRSHRFSLLIKDNKPTRRSSLSPHKQNVSNFSPQIRIPEVHTWSMEPTNFMLAIVVDDNFGRRDWWSGIIKTRKSGGDVLEEVFFKTRRIMRSYRPRVVCVVIWTACTRSWETSRSQNCGDPRGFGILDFWDGKLK